MENSRQIPKNTQADPAVGSTHGDQGKFDEDQHQAQTMRHNQTKNRYELLVGSEVATYISYVQHGNIVSIEHTVTDKKFRGQGQAGILTQFVVDDLRQRNLKIYPVCPYTAAWVSKHLAEIEDVLQESAK